MFGKGDFLNFCKSGLTLEVQLDSNYDIVETNEYDNTQVIEDVTLTDFGEGFCTCKLNSRLVFINYYMYLV